MRGWCVLRAALIPALALLPAQSSTLSWRFEPIQPDLFATGTTFVNAAADYDADGDIDLFVGFNGTPNRLYRNDRGVFLDVAAAAGIADARATRAAAWGDVDADGDPDLLVGFAPGAGSVLRLYRNDEGRFVDVTTASGIAVGAGAVRQPAWVDVDADGDLDLFVGFRDRADMLFRNAAGKLTDVAAEVGLADTRKTVGAVWFDYDEDGDLDLYAAHMDGDANGLYRNDKGRFTDVADAAGLAWGGRAPRDATNGTVRPCVADVDGDGRFDVFTANYGPNGLFLNRGGGRFEDVSAAWGINIDARYDTCAFGDVDNDGRVDLYVNGTVTGGKSYRDYLFRNTGTRFEDVTPDNIRSLEADHGALWADVDGDGDEDLALTGVQPAGMHLLLRNLIPAAAVRRSLRIRVLDSRGRATLSGAEVRVYAAGTRRLLAARLVDSGSSYDAQSDMPVHVGVGAAARVDVEVTYPAAGRREVSRRRGIDVRASRAIVVVQQASPAAPDRAQVLSAARDVMKQARYASLITISADGQPQARIIDPSGPDADLTVWIATNPATRKVAQLRKNSRATLFYFDRGTESYVTLLGSATPVNDSTEKDRHWQSQWAPHYPQGPRSPNFMLIRFTPRTLEIVSAPHKLQGDPKTWRPVVLDLSAPRVGRVIEVQREVP